MRLCALHIKTWPIIIAFCCLLSGVLLGGGSGDIQQIQQQKLKTIQLKPLVSSVRPKFVALQIGGKSIRISVSGKNLDLVKSTQVVFKGRKVGNITARLDRSWPRMRQISLKASSRAKSGTSLQLRLLDAEGKMLLDVPLKLFQVDVIKPSIKSLKKKSTSVVKPVKPKLRVPVPTSMSKTSLQLNPGKSVSVMLLGKNLDLISSVQIYLNNREVKDIKVQLSPPTAKGTKRKVRFKLSRGAKAQSGQYELRFQAKDRRFDVEPMKLELRHSLNPDDRIRSSSDKVTLRPIADLGIVSLRHQGNLVSGDKTTFQVRVKNYGTAKPESKSSGSFKLFKLELKREGEDDWQFFHSLDGEIDLEPGQIRDYKLSPSMKLPPEGDFVFRVVIDPYADVADINKDNNEMTREFIIEPAPLSVSFGRSRTTWGQVMLIEVSTMRDLFHPDHPVSLKVKFNRLEGTVERVDQQGLEKYAVYARVPEGATTGPVTVFYDGISGQSQNPLAIFGPPVISRFYPKVVQTGETVTIQGMNFVPSTSGDRTNLFYICNKYTHNECRLEVLSDQMSETEMRFQIPTDAVSGPLKIQTIIHGEMYSVSSEDALIIIPKIESFHPDKSEPGKEVNLYGSNLWEWARVEFNGIPAEVLGWIGADNGTAIKVRVPEGATTGKIKVTDKDGSTQSKEDFRVINLAIHSISPQRGPEGTVVTIEGQDLDLIMWASLYGSHGSVAISKSLEILEKTKNQAQLRIPSEIPPGMYELSVGYPKNVWSNRVNFEVIEITDKIAH